MFGMGNVPQKVKNAKLAKWYESSLTDQDRVKLNRYLDFADERDATRFILTVINAAIDDHNYRFAAKVADTAPMEGMTAEETFDVNEAVILAYFNTERYDEAYDRCEKGLALLKDPAVQAHVKSRTGDGTYPEDVICRNYKLNIVVGVRKDYDSADAVLDQFVADGLISAEEAQYRKNSVKTYRLERTFEGIFSNRRPQ